MPDFSQWRHDAAYAYFDELDAEGLAWECLRRNASYQADIAQLMSQADIYMAADDTCRRHWGLRFRDSSNPYRARHHRLLGTGGRRGRRHARNGTTGASNEDRARDDIATR